MVAQDTLADVFEENLNDISKEVEASVKKYIALLDERIECKTGKLLETQSKELSSLRNYFQHIVSSNSFTISNLKEQIDRRRSRLEFLENKIYKGLEELQQMKGPMEDTTTEILRCDRVLEQAKELKARFARKHKQKHLLLDDVHHHRWMNEVEMTKGEKVRQQPDPPPRFGKCCATQYLTIIISQQRLWSENGFSLCYS